jgi:parallel beta-helix repeat protein
MILIRIFSTIISFTGQNRSPRGKLLTSILLNILFISSIASAANYYVSGNGSDTNPGTFQYPYKTITKGISRLKAGDNLYVRSGIFRERIYIPQSGTENSPVRIMAYPGEYPVIDGEGWFPDGNWSSLIQLEGNYIWVSGFEVKNANTAGIYKGGAGVELYGHHNKVSYMKVHHCRENGIIAMGDFSIVEDCQVWQTVLSNSGNPGSADWSSGLSAARSPVDGITTSAILRRNIVYNNWGEGLSSYEAEGTLIEDNIVYDNWAVNLYISDTRNALVQRNIVYNTPNNLVAQRRPFTLGDERADKPRSANNTVINNFIYNADLWAFWSTGVPGSGLDNVLIAHNTIVNGQLQVGNSTHDGTLARSAIIENNIFLNYNGNPWEIMGSLNKITFSNNLWSSVPPKSLTGPGDVVGDPNLSKTGNTRAGELTAGYFRLLGTSPAINKGKTISNVNEDFFRTIRDPTPDIGGHEYIFEGPKVNVTKILITGDGGNSTIHGYNNSLQLNATVIPENASIKTLTWSEVNGTGQALISQEGLVTALSNGTVTAVAEANDGSGVESTLEITIDGIPSMNVIVSNNELQVFLEDPFLKSNLDLINLNGKLIYSKPVDSNLSSIDISYLLPGIYIILLSKSIILKTGKVIILRK